MSLLLTGLLIIVGGAALLALASLAIAAIVDGGHHEPDYDPLARLYLKDDEEDKHS